jgi:hypothetical protein
LFVAAMLLMARTSVLLMLVLVLTPALLVSLTLLVLSSDSYH